MPKLAVAFPGMGSQYVGMGAGLFRRNVRARQVFEHAGDILGFDVERLCREGPADALFSDMNAAICVVVHSLAAWSALQPVLAETESSVDLFCEHSLGIWTAAVASGALDVSDAYRLIQHTSSLCFENPGIQAGAMAVVIGIRIEEVDALLAGGPGPVFLAGQNAAMQFVVSGDPGAVVWACNRAMARGAMGVRWLGIARPLHSPLMRHATAALQRDLARISFRDPAIPIFSHYTASEIRTSEEVRKHLGEQLAFPVRFHDAARAAYAAGCDRVLEVGPGQVLGKLFRWVSRDIRVCHLDIEADLGAARAFLAGAS